MPTPTLNRDAADLPAASYRPPIESSADTWGDRARDVIASALPSQIGDRARSMLLDSMAAPIAAALESAAVTASAARREHELVNRLILEVRRCANPYLALRCLPIVFQLPSGEETQRDLAREFGLSPADVSKVCVTLQDRFGVVGRGMRRPETRAKYAERQRGRRARPLPQPYHWAGMAADVKSRVLALNRKRFRFDDKQAA